MQKSKGEKSWALDAVLLVRLISDFPALLGACRWHGASCILLTVTVQIFQSRIPTIAALHKWDPALKHNGGLVPWMNAESATL